MNIYTCKVPYFKKHFEKVDLPDNIQLFPGTLITDSLKFMENHYHALLNLKNDKIAETYYYRLRIMTTMFGDTVENEIIRISFEKYKVLEYLSLKDEECFDFLLQKNVFKKRHEISPRTNKPWGEWYDKLKDKAIIRAIKHAVDEKMSFEDKKRILKKEHDLVNRYSKVIACEFLFSHIKDIDKLNKMID